MGGWDFVMTEYVGAEIENAGYFEKKDVWEGVYEMFG